MKERRDQAVKKVINPFDASLLNGLPSIHSDDKEGRETLVSRLRSQDSKRVVEVFFNPASDEKDEAVRAMASALRRRQRQRQARPSEGL